MSYSDAQTYNLWEELGGYLNVVGIYMLDDIMIWFYIFNLYIYSI